MRKINFIKMIASGNDFVIAEVKSQKSSLFAKASGDSPSKLEERRRTKIKNLNDFARNICDRKYGIGADGLLVLEKSRIADVRMRIFNADGSEAEMCGNGARCVALNSGRSQIGIETKAGIIESKVKDGNVKIKLTEPRDIKLDIIIRINNRPLKVNFINTGVPHTVIFVEGLDKIDIVNLGRQIRYHRRFSPQGTNVDFVEVLSNNSIKIRTYERGVEDETFACGTGAVAASLISKFKIQKSKIKEHCKINVETKSGEILKVYFDRINNKFKDVWLEGRARIVYRGVYYVK